MVKKINGEILFAGKVAFTRYDSNWCGMSERTYPTVTVIYFENGTKKSERIYLGDECATRGTYTAEIDPEQKAMWEAYLAEQEAQRRAEREETERHTVRRGKQVQVVSGRKIKVGTIGECFWVGETQYGWSCGMKLADGSKVFTALRNVKVYFNPQLTLGAA